MASSKATSNPVLEPMFRSVRANHPKADLALLQRAYDVAEDRHSSQRRKSGDPYITHPLAVANILAELGMDTTTLVAALLHDTVEDTGYTLEALTAEFGTEVGHLVDGVTKLDKVVLGSAALSNPSLVAEAVKEFGAQLAVGIDAKNRKVATRGWLDTSEMDFLELARRMEDMGVQTLIYTDISRDGIAAPGGLEPETASGVKA